MILRDIDIVNFKNIAEAKLEFCDGVNCLLGMNGMGKSNLLEAIYFLSFGRPMSSIPDSALIRHGQDLLLVKGNFVTETGASDLITCGLTAGKGKSLKRNGKEYKKISEHIGRYPVVTVTPSDSNLVTGPGEERRRLMDMVISQANPDYLLQLIRYTRSLESRNRMLRAGVRDDLLFESVESSMEETAAAIHECRTNWIRRIAPEVTQYYSLLSDDRDKVVISYRSQLTDISLKELLNSRRQKDIVLGYTSAGPHRDDIEMQLDGYSLRRLGSQGQIKSFTVALRLTIFNYLKEARGITPLLLLDDIFDKLDAVRVAKIMQVVSSHTDFGQIFITDTNRKHLDDIIAALDGERTLVNVADGHFSKIETESENQN